MIAIIATAIACFVVGGILSYVLFRYVLKSKYDSVLKDAETEAEVIKKNKLLEVKEKMCIRDSGEYVHPAYKEGTGVCSHLSEKQ